MPFICPNNTQETSTTTGTGTLTLLGPVAGARDFDSQLASGDTCPYTIRMGAAEEYGIGAFTPTNQLARTMVLGSTNGGALVDFGAGTKDVIAALPGQMVQGLIDPDGTTGLTVRTATQEYARRTLQEGANVRLTNPGGIAGDPLIGVEGFYNPLDDTYGMLDGAADNGVALNLLFAALETTGGIIIIPPGSYHFTTQPVVTTADNVKIAIFAYGAEFTTAGAISGLKITGGSSNGGTAIYGLVINHRGNTTALNGFDIEDAVSTKLFDCTVESHDTTAPYAAFYLDTADPADLSAGCFWTTLDRCRVRPRSGADGTDPAYGVLIRGNCNGTRILNSDFSACVNCITLGVKGTVVTIANGVLIQGCTFEGFTNGVQVAGLAASTLVGLRILANRAETGTNFLSITGATAGSVIPPYLAGNMLISDVTTYINNPNDLDVNSLDMGITPAITGAHPNGAMSWRNNTEIVGEDGASWPLTVKPEGGNRGIRMMNNVGDVAFMMLWLDGTGVNTRGALQGQGSSLLSLNSVRGISFSSLASENLRGTIILSAGSGTVVFPNTEPDGSYYVATGSNAEEAIAVTAKTTAGFTVASSNATSTATVDWIMVR